MVCVLLLYGFVVTSVIPYAVCSNKVTPVGHLMPLGHQTPPSVVIDEFTIDNAPDPKTFFELYVKPGKAAIFRDAVKDAKGYNIWSDEYIRENYGQYEVRLEGKKESVHSTPIGETYLGRDNLRHFVDNYKSNTSKTYIVSELPNAMFKEAGILPSIGACGEMAKNFVEIDIWWSSGGSTSIIHKDAFNQINCLYRGTKYWKMYEYKYEKWIHKHWEPENEVGGYSDVDVEAVDLHRHPNFAKIPWSNFTINAGDCLFLPKSYYHQVNSDGPNNMAVSILFGRFDGRESIDTSDCTPDTDYKTLKHLNEFDVMWSWSGSGVMSMGWSDLEVIRNSMINDAQALEAAGKSLTAEILGEMWGAGGEDDGKLRQGNYSKAVAVIDTNGDQVISMKEAESANWDQLRSFIIEVHPYEPSNTYDFEYSFISYGHVLKILKNIMKLKEQFSRKLWIHAYVKHAHGTPKYANEIFTGLVGSETIDVVKSADLTMEVIDKALEKWLYYWQPQYSTTNIRPGTNVDVIAEEDDEEGFEEENDEEDDDRLIDEL